MFPRDGFPADLHLEIRTAPTRVIFEELHNERLDLGVVADVGADRLPAGLAGAALFDLDIVVILSPEHRLAASKEPIDIGALIAEPVIMNELSIGYGQIVATMFNDLGMRPRIRAVVDNVETIKVMVQAGMGVSLIPSGAAETEAKANLLAVRPISPARKITITAYRSRQSLSRRKEALFAELVAHTRTMTSAAGGSAS
jgi:DNA-binding transcriptional LysR family regulator